MKRVVLYYFSVFLVIGAFEYGQCDIKCYSCSSKQNPGCLNPARNGLEKRKCDLQALQDTKNYADSVDHKMGSIFEISLLTNNAPLPLSCIKQVTAVGKEEYTIRGCQLKTNQQLDICKKVTETAKRERINVTHCSVCDTDGCNPASSPKSSAPIFIPIGVLCLMKLVVIS